MAGERESWPIRQLDRWNKFTQDLEKKGMGLGAAGTIVGAALSPLAIIVPFSVGLAVISTELFVGDKIGETVGNKILKGFGLRKGSQRSTNQSASMMAATSH